MEAIILTLINLFVLTFVLTSMFGTGLSLTVAEIIEPLKNGRLVGMSLLVNFILVPALAYAIALAMGLEEGLRIGLIILACTAGAPFLPKLGQLAKGNIAFATGLMVLLMVVTVGYAPIVLPLLLPGVSVNPWDIAQPLITLMLIPLAVGLFIKGRYDETARSLQPVMNQISNVSLMMMIVLSLLVAYDDLLGAFGTGAFIASLLLVVGSLVFGTFLGGPGRETKSVLGLGSAQRNVSAAILIATQNFADPLVTLMVLIGASLMMAVLLLTASELGKRVTA